MPPRILLILALVLSGAAVAPRPASEPGPRRIVAFGDVHGDFDAARRALRLAGAIDTNHDWIGGDLVVVQTGDQLDRGDEEQRILDLFEKLRDQASAAGGAFHVLLGNHEIMNAKADLRYVTEGGFADFEDAVDFDPADPALAEFEESQRARMAALLPGRPYARKLAERNLILQLGETVFVHAGVLPHHVEYGIERINAETQAWLRGEAERPEIIRGGESPQWTRLYSDEPDVEGCGTLEEVLATLGATRMVMGHTVQDGGITAHCDGRAWGIDVGLAARYGGPMEVLQIVGDEVTILRESAMPPPQEVFWSSLQEHCGQAYEGRVVENHPPDPSIDSQPLTMHVRSCGEREIRIPFFVGEDRSRTWVFRRTPEGLRLKHDHRHEDGSEDEVTQYGGDTVGPGDRTAQSFHADRYTMSLIPAAATNVWTVRFEDGTFVYELERKGTERRFRAEFDLTRPVATPPPPWGSQ